MCVGSRDGIEALQSDVNRRAIWERFPLLLGDITYRWYVSRRRTRVDFLARLLPRFRGRVELELTGISAKLRFLFTVLLRFIGPRGLSSSFLNRP